MFQNMYWNTIKEVDSHVSLLRTYRAYQTLLFSAFSRSKENCKKKPHRQRTTKQVWVKKSDLQYNMAHTSSKAVGKIKIHKNIFVESIKLRYIVSQISPFTLFMMFLKDLIFYQIILEAGNFIIENTLLSDPRTVMFKILCAKRKTLI